MNYHTRITVPLSKQEFEALYQSARTDYRHPREQARYILRLALLGAQTQESKNPLTATLAERTANGFATGQLS